MTITEQNQELLSEIQSLCLSFRAELELGKFIDARATLVEISSNVALMEINSGMAQVLFEPPLPTAGDVQAIFAQTKPSCPTCGRVVEQPYANRNKLLCYICGVSTIPEPRKENV